MAEGSCGGAKDRTRRDPVSESAERRPRPRGGARLLAAACVTATALAAFADWRLQMDRILRLARLDRILLEQSYLAPGALDARGLVLASYLLGARR